VFTECDLVAVSRTLVGKEFHSRGPATEKALSLRRKFVIWQIDIPPEEPLWISAYTCTLYF